MAVELISHPAEYTDKMVGVNGPTTAFKHNWNIRALSQFLNTICTNSLHSPGSIKSGTHNLLDEVCFMYQPTTRTQHISTPEQTLPTDNVTEDSSTSSRSSTSTQLQTTDNHICTTGKSEHTTFITITDKKKRNSTKQCHIDTVADTPLMDTKLPVTTRNKKPKQFKENAPENQLNMQEHLNKKKKNKGFKGIETESLVESKSEKNMKKSKKSKISRKPKQKDKNFYLIIYVLHKQQY